MEFFPQKIKLEELPRNEVAWVAELFGVLQILKIPEKVPIKS